MRLTATKLSVAGLTLAGLLLSGCAPSNGLASHGTAGSAAAKDCPTVLIPKTTDNPYFTSVNVGAQDAAKELGAKAADFVGTAQTDVSGQIQRIQSASQRGACGIAVSAVDSQAVVPALRSAMKAGAKVVSYDADVSKDARTLFINQVDPTELGVTLLQLLAKDMKYQGTFAIISAQSTAANQNAWNAAAEAELKKPEYAKMKLVKTVYGDDDAKKSYDQAVALYQAYPDLGGILAPEPAGLEGAVKAKDDLKFNANLKIDGLGWPPSDAALLKNGKVTSFVLWSPVDLGYLTYYATNALVSGKITGAQGQTLDAGRLGKLTVGANGEIVMAKPFIYSKDNVDAALSGFRTK